MQNHICTIAIPVWNKMDVTRRCLESLAESTEYPHRVLIVDNGSDSQTQKFLEDFCRQRPDFRIKRFDENKGYLAAANYALSIADTPYLCLLNNDTILTYGWLSECISVLEARPDIGLVSPATNEISDRFKKMFESGVVNEYKGRFIEVNNCIGSCFVMKREVIEKVGEFDPVYTSGYFEEVDYCFRAKEAGFYSMMALGAFIYHIGSVSFKEMARYQKEVWHKNREIFVSKWGKPERILFFAKGRYDEKRLSEIRGYILERCRNRAIIDLYFKGDAGWIRDTHFNIRLKKGILYNALTLYLMIRLKKKSYDTAITDIKMPGYLKGLLKDTAFLSIEEIARH